jgi:hypothetical protein
MIFENLDNETDISKEIILQMIVKAINDTVDLDELMLTLLIFDVYSRMHAMNSSISSISQQTMTIEKAMIEMKKFRAERQVADSLAVGLGFGQKFKPDPRVGVRPGWTDQSSQPDPRVGVRRVLPSLFETSYIWKGEKKFFVSSI